LFCKANEKDYKSVLPGVGLRTLVFGQNTLFSEFKMQAGSVLPAHSHPHEQTGYLVRGRVRLTLGTDTFEARPGDSWCVLGGVVHSAETLEDSVAIEVFSPVREDYLPETDVTPS